MPLYVYDRQNYLLNNTYEYARNWKQPLENQQFQLSKNKNRLPISPLPDNANKKEVEHLSDSKLDINENRPRVEQLEEFSSYALLNQKKIPIHDWDPITDSQKKNLHNIPDRNLPYDFNQWYVETISDNNYQEIKQSAAENPFNLKDVSFIDSYRYAKVWWKNESHYLGNRQE